MKKTLQSILAASMMFQFCLAPTFANEEVVVEDEINAEETVTAPTVAENEEFNKGTWEKKDGKWVFKFEEGSYAENMTLEIGGKYYRFEGIYMCEGGWKLIEDGWFYFYADGHEASGWDKIGNKWYYFDLGYENKMTEEGIYEIEGKYYCFDANGAMRTGWVQDEEGLWSYATSSGAFATGWQKINNKWYRFDEYGVMMKGYTVDEEGNSYFLDESGAMITGWYQFTIFEDWSEWLYAYPNGKLATDGWHKINNKWYYFSEFMRTGYIEDGGKVYYCDDSGAMQTGWFKVSYDEDSYWMYADASGALHAAEWIGDYYLDADGRMFTYGYVYNEDNGNYYWVDKSGKYIAKWTTKDFPGEDYVVLNQKTGAPIYVF